MTHRHTLGLALFAASLACADIAAAATIRFDRSTIDLTPGERVTLEILGSDFGGGSAGGGVDLKWNADVLGIADAAADIELLFPGDQFVFSKGTLDAAAGTLTNVSTVSLTGITDSAFKIARITFTALAAGSSLLELSLGTLTAGPNTWTTSVGDPIDDLVFEPASLTVVAPVPLPAAIGLLPGALALLGVRMRRQRTPTLA